MIVLYITQNSYRLFRFIHIKALVSYVIYARMQRLCQLLFIRVHLESRDKYSVLKKYKTKLCWHVLFYLWIFYDLTCQFNHIFGGCTKKNRSEMYEIQNHREGKDAIFMRIF